MVDAFYYIFTLHILPNLWQIKFIFELRLNILTMIFNLLIKIFQSTQIK